MDFSVNECDFCGSKGYLTWTKKACPKCTKIAKPRGNFSNSRKAREVGESTVAIVAVPQPALSGSLPKRRRLSPLSLPMESR